MNEACNICDRSFHMKTALLTHKLNDHKVGKSAKVSKLIDSMVAQDILYSSDSECEYEVELRIKRVAKPKEIEEISSDSHFYQDSSELDIFDRMENDTVSTLQIEPVFITPQSIAKFASRQNSRQELIYECYLCKEIFPHNQILNVHFHESHQIKAVLNISSDMKMRKIKQKNFCLHCNTLFGQHHEYEEHLTALKMGKPFFCKSCFTPFDNRTEILKHKRESESCRKVANPKKLLCNYCGKYFERKYTLTIHMRSHMNNKPFKCEICLKSFLTLGAQKQHMYLHSGVRPYVCLENDCGKSFSYLSALRQHKKNVHELRRLKCEYCDRMFSKREHKE